MDGNSGIGRKVVILGGGIGGLRTALKLERKLWKFKEWNIILIDENDYHQYTHRLHEVAGDSLSDKAANVPFQRLLEEKKKIFFRQAIVMGIEQGRKIVKLSDGLLSYDFLVIALGSHTEYFGIDGLKTFSVQLKNIRDACTIRKRLDELFHLPRNGDAASIVIGGGGFTGTELVGEIAERIHSQRESSPRIYLVEAMSSILPGWNPELADEAAAILRRKGVEIILNDPLVRVEEGNVKLKTGRQLNFSLLVWTGGVSLDDVCVPPMQVKYKRICIDEFSGAAGFPGIYVVGDCALIYDPKSGVPLPPSAHIAFEQADVVAYNVYAEIAKLPRVKLRLKPAGQVVSLGGHDAVGEIWGLKLRGLTAVLAKKLIHIGYVWSIGNLGLLLARAVGKEVC